MKGRSAYLAGYAKPKPESVAKGTKAESANSGGMNIKLGPKKVPSDRVRNTTTRSPSHEH